MIHNFGNSFKAILEGREKNQRHSTKNKLMTALPARDRGLDSLAYRICFGIYLFIFFCQLNEINL